MKRTLIALVLAVAGSQSWAAGPQDCSAAAGSYLTGVVVQGPKFAHGQYRAGVELSHTHLKLRADQDGRTYDVAIDNVFASGYEPGQRGVPSPIEGIRVDDRLELCGKLYDRGVGIHFVHNNCGARPTPDKPDGWIRVLDRQGQAGGNLEASTNYCPLFGAHKRGRAGWR